MTKSPGVKHWPSTVFVLAAAAVLPSCSTAVDGSPTAAPQAVTSSASSPAAAPPPGAELQALVLPADELRRIMNDPSLVKTATWRHPGVGLSIVFTPPQCSVVSSNGLHAALDGSGYTGVYYANYTSTAMPMVQASQGVVGFADPGAAHALVGAQQAVWQQCANIDVTLKVADQTGSQHNNALQVDRDTLTMLFGIGPGTQCMRTMAAKNAIVVDNLVCSADPAAAATAILNGMLDKVH